MLGSVDDRSKNLEHSTSDMINRKLHHFTLLKVMGRTKGAHRLSAAEKQRRYRARRDADPERRERHVKKQQQKYREDMASGRRKAVNDISQREKRRRRKKWRETYYRIKSRKEALKHLTTPPDTPQISPDRTNPESSTSRPARLRPDQNRMSEDSSSDDDRHVSKKRNCWECGKKFSSLKRLMLHYKSHNINVTCHICKVTFQRLTSLSTHLDNAHSESPPFCTQCHGSFSNVWELNKNAETHCTGSAPFQEAPSLITTVKHQSPNSDWFPHQETAGQSTNSKPRPQTIEMKPETSENSVEYIVGEDDMESDCENADDSTSSESDDKDQPGDFNPDDTDSDGSSISSSTDCSRDPSYNPFYEKNPAVHHSPNSSICAGCGRGPFRYIKRHLLHCSGVRVKYQCTLCKKLFLTEKSLNEHYMPLYTCDVCGQIFSNENSYKHHQCPKGSKSPLVLFCSNSLPQACKVCKSFFTSEKTLLNHVTKVHTSVVSTKVCIITDPSALTDKKASPGVHGTAAQSAISSPNVVNQVVNGKLHVGFNSNGDSGSLSNVVKSSPSSAAAISSNPGQSPVPMYLVSAPALDRSRKDCTTGEPTNRPLSRPSRPATEVSDPVSPPVPTIMAMFENASHHMALMKRMSTGWRSKVPYPCRQCGAILRQSSLIISHRYLHRGPRSHHCHCGRAFKHRLHLLRHCVQHAETITYICVSCGQTFTGAKLLAEHMKGKSRKESCSGDKCKGKVKRKCKMSFICDCGQLFIRPSAYIWHQLRNRAK